MANFVKGEVVVLPFPFSDLSTSKKRPALVLASLPGNDIILCQITSVNTNKNSIAIPLNTSDFKYGNLPKSSFIRPAKIFTADKNLIIRSTGEITTSLFEKVYEELINLFKP